MTKWSGLEVQLAEQKRISLVMPMWLPQDWASWTCLRPPLAPHPNCFGILPDGRGFSSAGNCFCDQAMSIEASDTYKSHLHTKHSTHRDFVAGSEVKKQCYRKLSPRSMKSQRNSWRGHVRESPEHRAAVHFESGAGAACRLWYSGCGQPCTCFTALIRPL